MSLLHFLTQSGQPGRPGGPPIDFTGRWTNNLNSEMELDVLTAGSVSGVFRTGVDSPQTMKEFPLAGFASDDLIVFSVNFGASGSLATWAGQYTIEAGDERIHTRWHIARNIPDPDEPAELWSSILSGENIFERA